MAKIEEPVLTLDNSNTVIRSYLTCTKTRRQFIKIVTIPDKGRMKIEWFALGYNGDQLIRTEIKEKKFINYLNQAYWKAYYARKDMF